MPDFNGNTLIITLDSGNTAISVEHIYSDWKEWYKLIDNAKYPEAFRTSGGDPLTPGIEAGSYFFLNNSEGWRIRPPEEDINILISGNLAPENPNLDMVIPTVGDFTALLVGLQPITQKVDALLEAQQTAEYNGTVFIDFINGAPGTTYPVGTHSAPVDNRADAFTIANDRSFRHIDISRGLFTVNQATSAWIFTGSDATAQFNTGNNDVSLSTIKGLSLTNTSFIDSVSGTFMENCKLDDVHSIKGEIRRCEFVGLNTICEGTNVLYDCFSGIAGTETPMIGFRGNASSTSIRNWTGGMEIEQFTNTASLLSIDMDPGHIVLANTVTEGTIVLRGVGHITDNMLITSNCTIIKTGFFEVDKNLTTSKFLQLKD